MSVFGIGVAYGIATLLVMFSGMPIAFALGAVAVVFMGIYMPAASLDTVTQTTWAPPLWIPYGMMAVGMSVLTVQIFLQLLPKKRGV